MSPACHPAWWSDEDEMLEHDLADHGRGICATCYGRARGPGPADLHQVEPMQDPPIPHAVEACEKCGNPCLHVHEAECVHEAGCLLCGWAAVTV